MTLEIAEKANRLVLDVVDIAERRGLRFPREFALLIKQMLYFDRFVQELAPDLDVLTDDRVNKQLRGMAKGVSSEKKSSSEAKD